MIYYIRFPIQIYYEKEIKNEEFIVYRFKHCEYFYNVNRTVLKIDEWNPGDYYLKQYNSILNGSIL